jgi:hypothetical protein
MVNTERHATRQEPRPGAAYWLVSLVAAPALFLVLAVAVQSPSGLGVAALLTLACETPVLRAHLEHRGMAPSAAARRAAGALILTVVASVLAAYALLMWLASRGAFA